MDLALFEMYFVSLQNGKKCVMQRLFLLFVLFIGVCGMRSYGQDLKTFTVKGVTFKMVKVEGGSFFMGATTDQGENVDEDEKPVREMEMSTFYIGQTEVTQELWVAVMGDNPSEFIGGNHPVEEVSWEDCQQFVFRLSQLTGENFRLPTESEWEYAARGGQKSNLHIFSGSNNLDDVAWYWLNSNGTTHPVATKKPNELGLYDMSGNVLEWCQDIYCRYDAIASIESASRVVRGGSWMFDSNYCRVANRNKGTLSSAFNHLGLRLVL